MSSKIRTVSIELTSNDAQYILHAFKKQCNEKIDANEEGNDDLTRMYANDILEAKMVYEKVNKVTDPEFGKEALQDFYELL